MITPARAGKTLFDPQADNIPEDHPRACGENSRRQPEYYTAKASPPRVRGKLSTDSPAKAGARITPARAGKTEPEKKTEAAAEDHPRACGENATGVAG